MKFKPVLPMFAVVLILIAVLFQNCSKSSEFNVASNMNAAAPNNTLPSEIIENSEAQKTNLFLISPLDFTNTQYVMNFNPFDKSRSYVIGRHMGGDIYQRPITDLMKPDLYSKTLISYDPIAGSFPHNPMIQTFLPNTIQHKDSEFGFVISTKDLKNLGRYTAISGGGPHWIIGRDFSPVQDVFTEKTRGIDFSVHAAVPSARYKDINGQMLIKGDAAIGYSVGQLSFVYYFKHKQLNEYVVILVNLYEPQGVNLPQVMHDGQVSFVSLKLGTHGAYKYAQASLNSASYSDVPFATKRFFSAQISKTEFLNALASINEFRKSRNESILPSEADQYGLESALILFEVPNYVFGQAETEVSAYLKDFTVKLIE